MFIGISLVHLQKPIEPKLSFALRRRTRIGSLVYVCEPFGSILSAFITGSRSENVHSNFGELFFLNQNIDSLGRKWAMIVVNAPFAIAWLLLYYANDVWMILVAITLMGLAIGLMESPVITYIGEIWQVATIDTDFK